MSVSVFVQTNKQYNTIQSVILFGKTNQANRFIDVIVTDKIGQPNAGNGLTQSKNRQQLTSCHDGLIAMFRIRVRSRAVVVVLNSVAKLHSHTKL